MSHKDVVGSTLHRWTVIAEQPPNRHGQRIVSCRCECGTVKRRLVLAYIESGRLRDCGCFRRTRLKRAASTTRTHGDTDSTEYIIWAAMIQRCENPKRLAFDRYGGRGITVCERWHRYENFLADMGRRPSPEHSIDRIDNDGNYEPGNVRWATKVEQARNKSPRQKPVKA